MPKYRIHHINVRVSDLNESIRFYQDVLGFQLNEIWDLRPVSNTKSAYLSLGDVTVELAVGHDMSLYTPNGIVNHFGVEVDDIYAEYERLKAMNVKILGDIVNVNDKFYCFFFEGPSKERFEAVQLL